MNKVDIFHIILKMVILCFNPAMFLLWSCQLCETGAWPIWVSCAWQVDESQGISPDSKFYMRKDSLWWYVISTLSWPSWDVLGKEICASQNLLVNMIAAWDIPGMIIGRSCEGNSVCDGYNTFLRSCDSVLRRPWETARKKPVMYSC